MIRCLAARPSHRLIWSILDKFRLKWTKLLPGPEAPDLTVSPEAEPALTLVFDREGWSPALFARLARRGIAVITWHKGFRGEPWPEADFRTVTVPIHGPAATRTVTVRLAEKRVRLNAGPEVRQIRRRLDSGRQVPLVTTNGRMPLERVAGAMFSRWSQENIFKTMGEAFNLDALPVHALADPEPEARVVNPAWRERDRHIRRLRQKPGEGIRRVRILDSASNAGDAAIAGLLDELNQTRTIFPGTGLRTAPKRNRSRDPGFKVVGRLEARVQDV